MISTVTGKNQLTIPAEIAHRFGIRRGTQVEWTASKTGRRLQRRILPSRGELARRLCGAGRKRPRPGEDPIAELLAERGRDEAARTRALESR